MPSNRPRARKTTNKPQRRRTPPLSGPVGAMHRTQKEKPKRKRQKRQKRSAKRSAVEQSTSNNCQVYDAWRRELSLSYAIDNARSANDNCATNNHYVNSCPPAQPS